MGHVDGDDDGTGYGVRGRSHASYFFIRYFENASAIKVFPVPGSP
jgi:hypothetical protein